jgi:hypothetical protein
MVSHEAVLCLHVQVTLTHQFAVIKCLKISVELLVIVLQYCLMFVLKEHVCFAVAY